MGDFRLPGDTRLNNGKYKLENDPNQQDAHVLGAGGFGITYRGFDEKLERKIAIKEFFLQGDCYRYPNDPHVYPYEGQKAQRFEREKQRFIEEGRALATLDNQAGVVNVYDFFEENNTAYLVMEFVQGESLQKKLDEQGGRFSVQKTLSIMRPVILALAGVHRKGIIHRDISPDNIMITFENKVKLIDFGAAVKSRDMGEMADESGQPKANKPSLIGKRYYSPIEQLTADGVIGPYSDVYAICATIYYCMTGRKIVPAFDRVYQDTLVPPSALGVAVTPQTESVLMWGLAVLPENRIPDAACLYQYLYGAEVTQPVTLRNPTGQQVQDFTNSAVTQMLSDMQKEQKKRYKKSTIITAVCTLAFLLAGIGMYVVSAKKKATASVAETEESTQAEEAAASLDDENCEAYAEEFYNYCKEKHEKQGKNLEKLDEFSQAAKNAASQGAELYYTNSDELSSGLSEIGNRALENYKIPNTGWVMYTFTFKESVENVKRALDTYVLQINTENQGKVNLDSCEYMGVSVARAKDGTYFWAVFYR